MSNQLTAFAPLNPAPKQAPQRTVLFGFDEDLEVESSEKNYSQAQETILEVKSNDRSVEFSFNSSIDFKSTTSAQTVEEKPAQPANSAEPAFQSEWSELFGNTLDTTKDMGVNAVASLGNVASETFGAGKDLLQDIFGGGQADKKPVDPDKEAKQKVENMALRAKTQEIQASLQKAHQEFLATIASDTELENINKKVGFSNTSFRGIKNSDGSIRLDINAILHRQAVEQVTKEQREKAKASALAMSSKKSAKGSGPSVNMNTALEDQNMNRPG